MTARLARVRRSLDYSVERLARDLAQDGYLAEQDDDGTILLREDDVETWDPPVRLAFTDAGLRGHLLSMAQDAQEVFPDVDAVQAAYQLLHVHLDEEVATSVMAGSSVTIGPRGLDVDPVREPEPWPDLDPDGGYGWVASPPEGCDGTLEFLSPEQVGARYGALHGRDPDLSQQRGGPPRA
ncbi:hypothetical protein [Blastococcus sp. CT_GayMR16]|uniref:hypothetical protein n=1 Tax=Blastococcus sp. CT_GayMR16 TaxID=2559607 RepID=UPI001073B07A|nr:hypothetical protein [Blastococcus sp. CT_GayMR16]TFV87819.1 hypothetical protein E4P38_12660 [Blastococcus sp. CT_GayMR16]